MKALLAFIIMAAVIVTLIEVNERIKARKSKDESQKTKDCPPEQTAQENCSACALMEVCEKEQKKKTGR